MLHSDPKARAAVLAFHNSTWADNEAGWEENHNIQILAYGFTPSGQPYSLFKRRHTRYPSQLPYGVVVITDTKRYHWDSWKVQDLNCLGELEAKLRSE